MELITADVLTSLDLDGWVEPITEKECMAFGDALTTLVKDEARWTPAQIESLCFAGAVLSMMFRPSEPSEPFGPMFVMGNSRSAIPTDFPRPALLGLLDWAIALKDPELRARFLDLIWVGGKNFAGAQGAVEAYLESARRLEHPEEWPPCAERFERALRLAASLGKGGLQLRQKALDAIEDTVRRAKGMDPLYLTHRLIGLLLEFRRGDANQLAQFALTAAERAESAGNFWCARDYHQRTAECHAVSDNPTAQGIALRRAAEALVMEAEAAIGQPGRGAMTGASILAQAIDAMRQAPGGKDRAELLHDRLLQMQSAAIGEMKPVSTSIDSTELIERSLNAVRDKTFRDAVISLCGLSRPPSLDQLRKQVHEQARKAFFGTMFHGDIVNSRGRVVAKSPPLVHGATDINDAGLRFRMFEVARLRRGLAVQAMLNPAREEILAAHNPSRHDVVDLIRHSPWLPHGHAEAIAKALVAGFHGDMLVATHLVPPQFEAMVRHVVEAMGGTTSMFDPNGLQPERSLNSLLETDEALRAFGDAGLFEIQDIFVDQLGTNLRNEVAHGLINDDGLFGTDALYAWWSLLRYCVLTSQRAQNLPAKSQDGNTEIPDAGTDAK